MKVSETELLMTKMLAKVTSFTAEDLSLNLRIYVPDKEKMKTWKRRRQKSSNREPSFEWRQDETMTWN